MRSLFLKLRILLTNLFYLFVGFLHGRNAKYILFGSWGGLKFADNSRYLFQYLSQNKEKYSLKKVVWVTRDPNINLFLNNSGYESYLIGTKESKKMHFKCGVHIICNMAYSSKEFKADIETKYSCGAKKIQLWHGVGIKTIGKASNLEKQKKRTRISKLAHFLFSGPLFKEGCWSNEYFLCTSPTNLEINSLTNYCKKKRMFISSYPRGCKCLRLFPNEIDIINEIKKHKGCILYLPTFRSDESNYTHPLAFKDMQLYLLKNDFIFIEKPHSASNFTFANKSVPNVLFLEQSFDINVLYDYCSCIVSDYSSAAFDGIHYHKPVILYTPDIANFKNGDVGLFLDIEKEFNEILSSDINGVMRMIDLLKNGLFFDDKVSDLYRRIDEQFFGGTQKEYDAIWNDICKIINIV